jgi:hypothetical protein
MPPVLRVRALLIHLKSHFAPRGIAGRIDGNYPLDDLI